MPDHVRLDVLRVLHAQPAITQRALAARLKVSLGRANAALKLLVFEGYLVIERLKQGNRQSGRRYVLTPAGISAMKQLAESQLQRHQRECRMLKREIKAMSTYLTDE